MKPNVSALDKIRGSPRPLRGLAMTELESSALGAKQSIDPNSSADFQIYGSPRALTGARDDGFL